jgi:hypothetical protein
MSCIFASRHVIVVSISMARVLMHVRGAFSKLFLNPAPIFRFLPLMVYLFEIVETRMLWKGRSGQFHVLHLTSCCSGCPTSDAS